MRKSFLCPARGCSKLGGPGTEAVFWRDASPDPCTCSRCRPPRNNLRNKTFSFASSRAKKNRMNRRGLPPARPRPSRAWAWCWLLRLRLRSRPRWCRRWRSRRAVGRMRVCWAVQGEEAPGHGFFACLSVWFGCMIPGLYEVISVHPLSLYPVCTKVVAHVCPFSFFPLSSPEAHWLPLKEKVCVLNNLVREKHLMYWCT
jgi:hypothetical protein